MNTAPTNQLATAVTPAPAPAPAPAPPEQRDDFITKKELALKLRKTVRTVENWQQRGVLPYVKIGKAVLFHWPDVVEHIKNNYRVCRRTIFR